MLDLYPTSRLLDLFVLHVSHFATHATTHIDLSCHLVIHCMLVQYTYYTAASGRVLDITVELRWISHLGSSILSMGGGEPGD